MPSRFVLDELNLNFATLATGLRVLIIIVIVLIWSGSLDAAIVVAGRVETGLRIRDAVTSRERRGVPRVVVGTGGGLRVVVRHGREKYFIFFYLKILLFGGLKMFL